MNIREYHVKEMRSRVEHILSLGPHNSAKEIIEYRYDQASVRRIIDEMNRNGWFDW